MTVLLSSIFLFTSILQSGVFGGPHERRLLNDLLAKYNNLERPVFNESEPLKLSLGLTLQQIIDVDEKNQILTTNIWLNLDEKNQLLTTNVWLNLQWEDVNMKWNKSEYGGVEDIRIPPAKLWKPDVLMYNSADEAFDGTYPTNVVVYSTGSCTYIPPGIFKSTCKIDITWFPFDDQDCEMKFGSWTYNGFKLDLQTQSDEGVTSTYVLNGEWALLVLDKEGEGETSTFIPNGEWLLLGVPGKRNEVFYDCCPEPYLDVTFVIKIRRRTLYYFFNLIVPCVLIASMAVLGFTLPPDSGEKLSLGVTVLLSLTVFQQNVSEAMPVTSLQVPLLGVTILLSLTVFLNMVSATMPVTSDNPLLGVTILLSLTVFSQVVAEAMPATSDAVPLLGVTILLSLTVFSIMVNEMLPKVSDAVPILGVTIMLSITIFATIVGEMLPVSDATPLIGVAIMLSITIFATIVGEMLPVSDATPLIGTYFNCIMFMVASSVVTTIMILNYHHRLADTHEMPNWVRCVFLQWIPWVLRMGRPGEKITRKTILMQNKMKELDLKERSSKSLLANVLDMDDDFRPASALPHLHSHHPSHSMTGGTAPVSNSSAGSGFRVTPGLHPPPPPPPPPPPSGPSATANPGDVLPSGEGLPGVIPPGIHRELSLILKEIRVITDKIREDEDTAAIENDWKFAAMVLDRLCLITFTMFTIIATVAVLFSAPHIIVT